jgi:hypothetical protein
MDGWSTAFAWELAEAPLAHLIGIRLYFATSVGLKW